MVKESKRMKDPLAPRKPLSPYMEFVWEQRKLVDNNLESLTLAEAGRELGRRWKSLEPEEKQKFVDKSKENRDKYDKEMEEYRKIQKPMPPKKPPSTYVEFFKIEKKKVLEEFGSLREGELGKEVGKRWRELPREEKKVFEEITKKNYEIYHKDLAAFLEKSAESPTQLTAAQAEPSGDKVAPAKSPSALEVAVAKNAPDATFENSEEEKIAAEDLGFARQKGYNWHPALKTGEGSRGQRIKVKYFGTYETGTVDRVKWVRYSEQSESKICSTKLLVKPEFKLALEQLKNMLRKIYFDEGQLLTSSDIGVPLPPVGRKLVKLSKEGLMKDEEQNMMLMKQKIVELKCQDGPFKFSCKDCNWKGKFSHKARAHARDCGRRKKVGAKKPNVKKYSCSGDGCTLTFSLLSKLQQHYRLQRLSSVILSCIKLSFSSLFFCRLSHFKLEQGYKCRPCRKSFSTWRSFKRHRVLKHDTSKSSSLSCQFCAYKSDRADNIARHEKLNHSSSGMVTSLVLDIVYEALEVTAVEMDNTEKNSGQDQVEESVNEEREVSDYEKIRNLRIAEREAEFRRLFPTFDNDVRSLKVAKKARKKKTKSPSGLPPRRSSRGLDMTRMFGGREDDPSSQPVDATTVVEDVTETQADHIDHSCAGSEEKDQQVEADSVACVVAVGEGTDELVQRECDGVVGIGKFGCLPCGLTFRDTANLRRHVRLVHEARDFPVKCPRTWCDKEFAVLREMRQHSQNCFLICPHAGCTKTFRKENLFAAHQRAHQVMARRMTD